MSRYTRNTAVLVKVETTQNTDAAPTEAANAFLVSNQRINPLVANNVDRALTRPYFGASEQLVGSAHVEVSFDVELVGSGTQGTAPAWGVLLRTAAMAATVSADERVDYLPVTDAQESATVYYFDSGVLHKLLGAKADVQINAKVGEIARASVTYRGLYGGVEADAPGALTLSAWRTPQVTTHAFSAGITLGASLSATPSAVALTGGTAYPSMGLELSLGNQVEHTVLLGREAIDVVDREVTGKVMLELTAAQEVSFMGLVRANTVQSMAFAHGTVEGDRLMLFAPRVQLLNPTKEELNGRRLVGFDVRCVPDGAGNNELRVVTSF